MIDVVILVDATRTMQPCIDWLARNIEGIMWHTMLQSGSPTLDWRCKIVGYRDFVCDGEDWFEDNLFVREADALKAQADRLYARGGSGERRSLLDAIWRVGALEAVERGFEEDDPRRWRHRRDAMRVVVILTNAGYHPKMSLPEAAGGTFEDIYNQCIRNNIFLVIFAPEMACYDELASIKKAEYLPWGEEDEDGNEALNRHLSDDGSKSPLFPMLVDAIDSPFRDARIEAPFDGDLW